MAYPTTLDDVVSLPPRTDNDDDVMAEDVNDLQAAIIAIETELGTDPAGNATNLVTRLSRVMDAAGYLGFTDATTKVISNGAITITQTFHRVDTEAAASSDNLDTINGAGTTASFLILRCLVGTRNIVIKHNIGNIQCCGAIDITLDNTFDFAFLFYDPTLTKWLALSAGTLTAAATLSGNNTWTGTNQWNSSVGYKYTAVSIDTTLDATQYMINVDATGGAKVITLPTAIGIVGRVYIIRRVNSGGNAVTVDGDGSETINGSTTHALTAQNQTVSIMSDGTNWMIVP